MSGKTSRKGNKKKHHRTRKQFYKMKGCSKKKRGGNHNNNTGLLAFPSNNVPAMRNTNLAYTGGNNGIEYSNAYPNQSIDDKLSGVKQYVSWLNNQTSNAHGGGKRTTSSSSSQNGGSCSSCAAPLLQSGGNNGLPYGQGLPPMKGIPYAGGTAGAPLVPGNIATEPGVKPVDSNGNHYNLNSYNNGFTTNPKNEVPMLGNFKGGKMRNNNRNRSRSSKNMKGGYNYSNSVMQDFVNLGRQFTYGLGSTYNALNGYQKGPSPLPWQGQLSGTPGYNALKLLKY